MIRFLLLTAVLSIYSSAFSQSIKLINAREVIEKGKQLYDSGKYTQAIDEYLTIPKRDTGYVLMLTELALAYIANENFDKAITVCDEGLTMPSENRSHLLRSKAIATDRKGDYDKSVEIFNKSIDAYPFDFSLIYNLGITYYNHKEYDKAIECFFKVLAINPFHSGAHLNLARLSSGQGKKTHAMLSFGIYLGLNNEDNERLVMLDNVLSNQLKEDGSIPYNGANAFEKLDQIIRAKIAMDKNYKTSIDFDVATVRQFQMFFEQLSTFDANAPDPWNYYVPIYQSLKQNELIEPFICHIMTSAKNEQVAKWKKKNEKKTNVFFETANASIRKKREKLTAPALGFPNPTSGWYDNDNNLEAIGNKDQQAKNDGKWIYYKSNDEKAAEGNFKAGEKTGTWTYYKVDGSVSSVENYETGEVRVYSEGANTQHFFLKNHKIHGDVELYNKCGKVIEKLVYNSGKRNGPGKLFFASGKLKQTYNNENDLVSGEVINYYETGIIEKKMTYKEGKLNGPSSENFPNGKLKMKGDYKEGEITGEWKYYFGNGALERSGHYENGAAIGEWTYFDARGNLTEKRLFKAGKFEGDNTHYFNGKVSYVNTYKEDLLIKITYYDQAGKVVANSGNASGTFSSRGYFPSGQLAGEGQIKNGKLDGSWKYYYPEGRKRSEFVYVDGKAEGGMVEYHRTGSKKYVSHYKAGELDGYFAEYYEHGQVKQEGWFQNGQRQQQWVTYYPNGVKQNDYYYMNDELVGHSYEFNPEGKLSATSEYKDELLVDFKEYDEKGQDIVKRSKSGDLVTYETTYGSGKPRSQFVSQCGDYIKVTKWFPNGKPYYSFDLLSGKKEGSYKDYAIGGQVLRDGSQQNNKREGIWNTYFEDGKLESKGKYLQGESDSTWVFYYENGEMSSSSEYSEDERHGVTRIYSPDGKPLLEKLYYQGNLLSYREVLNDKPGDWLLFDGNKTIAIKYPNGTVAYEETYKNGVLDGAKRTNYSNGNPCSEYQYAKGGYHGDYKTYYANGRIREKGAYSLGEVHGVLEKYNDDGSLASRENYVMGMRQGKTQLFVKGSKTAEYNFDGGMTYE